MSPVVLNESVVNGWSIVLVLALDVSGYDLALAFDCVVHGYAPCLFKAADILHPLCGRSWGITLMCMRMLLSKDAGP